MKFERNYGGKVIRVMVNESGAKGISNYSFVAIDISKALNFINPRGEIIKLVGEIHYDRLSADKRKGRLERWGDAEFYMMDFGSLLELSLRAESSSAKKFINWLVDEIMGNEMSIMIRNSDNENIYYKENRKNLFATTQIAKQHGLTAIQLNQILYEKGIQFRVNDQWVLYKNFHDEGFTEVVEIQKPDKLIMHTYWTLKGKEFIDNIINRHQEENGEQLELELGI